MSFPYSTRYDPPIPALEIVLRAPEGNPSVGPLLALVDTGADGTGVPAEHMEQLEAIPIDWARLRGQWNEGHLVRVFLVDLQVGETWLPDVEIVEDRVGRDTLLGRNVLNRLRLLLDGPEETAALLP
jgi:predicted aspartyl protease